MDLVVEPLKPEDTVRWQQIFDECYADDPTTSLIFRQRLSSDSFAKIIRLRTGELHMPGAYIYKAVLHENGESNIVGIAKWTVFPQQKAQEDKQPSISLPSDATTQADIGLPPPQKTTAWIEPDAPPPEVDVKVLSALLGPLRDAHVEIMGDETHSMLNTLVVDPSYQHRGIGTSLLKHGLESEECRGLPCYLDATKRAKSMYEKAGFKTVKTVEFDRQPFGGPGVDHHYCMVKSADNA